MSSGKSASQAGHAFLGAFLQCKNPATIKEYHKEFPNSPGTKVCLSVPTLEQLLEAETKCKELEIPYFVVVDSGCKNFFDGKPIITALGIGPVKKSQVKQITERFKLL